ncbi:MAG: hypothetical protein Q4C01_07225, partial [Clostridia bacterium]|nr:hypothetical protein [Clostridia bacterium]
PQTPTILGWKRPGKIGSCWKTFQKQSPNGGCFFAKNKMTKRKRKKSKIINPNIPLAILPPVRGKMAPPNIVM